MLRRAERTQLTIGSPSKDPQNMMQGLITNNKVVQQESSLLSFNAEEKDANRKALGGRRGENQHDRAVRGHKSS